jgi:hypothetical protein
MSGACSTNGEERNASRIFEGKPEGKSHWGNQGVGGWTVLGWILERYNGMEWIELMWLRIGTKALVNMILNLRVPLNAGKLLSGCTIGGSSRRTQLRE